MPTFLLPEKEKKNINAMPAHVCNKVTGEAAASSASDIFVASNIWIPELWGKTERRLHLQYLGQENEI